MSSHDINNYRTQQKNEHCSSKIQERRNKWQLTFRVEVELQPHILTLLCGGTLLCLSSYLWNPRPIPHPHPGVNCFTSNQWYWLPNHIMKSHSGLKTNFDAKPSLSNTSAYKELTSRPLFQTKHTECVGLPSCLPFSTKAIRSQVAQTIAALHVYTNRLAANQ